MYKFEEMILTCKKARELQTVIAEKCHQLSQWKNLQLAGENVCIFFVFRTLFWKFWKALQFEAANGCIFFTFSQIYSRVCKFCNEAILRFVSVRLNR